MFDSRLCNCIMDSTSQESSRESNLVLYSFWQSSCAWRIRFALNLKGLPYEYKSVNLPKGEQFSPEFEKINPLHMVPVLVDGDVVISDSYAIFLYLEEKYPQKPLLPADCRLKALNLQAAGIISSGIQPLHMMAILKLIEEKVGPDERLPWALHHIEKGFQGLSKESLRGDSRFFLLALERLLEDTAGKYATGDELYMADVFLAPQIAVAAGRFKVDMNKFPTLRRIYESYESLPEYQASLPQRQPDAA